MTKDEILWFESVLHSRFDKSVLVLGDIIVDEYIHGSASRLSPEAPVPVVKLEKKLTMLGGAGNVAANLTALGVKCSLIGCIGTDDAGKFVLSETEEKNILNDFIIQCSDRVTPLKTRVIADGHHVVRVDHEDTSSIREDKAVFITQNLIAAIRTKAYSALVVEDYAKGTLNGIDLPQLFEECRNAEMMSVLDPHVLGWKRFSVPPDFITPNLKEACVLAQMNERKVRDDQESLEFLKRLSDCIHQRVGSTNVIITLGDLGMFFSRRSIEKNWFLSRPRTVFDVSGAGDTAVSAFVAGRLSSMTLNEAVTFSNLAAGVAVSKVGTSTVSWKEVAASV